MKKKRLYLSLILSVLLITGIGYIYYTKRYIPQETDERIGQIIDSFNGVYVHYNGSVSHTGERNRADDGYNLGMKYQCVEFVKRYYYQHYKHKMPDTYGNAKDFFDASLPDSTYNAKRDLYQFTNGSSSQPQVGDLIIFGGTIWNKYGHVAIVCNVSESTLTIIQQNGGPAADTRVQIPLTNKDDLWAVERSKTLGWLRKMQ